MTKSLKELKMTPKRIELLERLNLFNSDDILRYYPYKYLEMELKPFSEWKEKDFVIFRGLITSHPYTFRTQPKRSITKFRVLTNDQDIVVSMFNRPWARDLKEGRKITITGQYVGEGKVILKTYNYDDGDITGSIIPQYPLKEGITNKQIIGIIRKTYDLVDNEISNEIPMHYMHKYQLLDRQLACKYIHFPNSNEEIVAALRTLKYEEFLKFNLVVALLRRAMTTDGSNIPKIFDRSKINSLVSELSFELTEDQKSTLNQILDDMSSDKVMYRLLQGDVGSGKTIVASMALYAVYLSGKQGAFMVPTEILAKQHLDSLTELFEGLPLNIELIYSSLSKGRRKEIVKRLEEGAIDILIGTHAIFQDDVQFKDLGLVITDEQHRFGVNQRRRIKEKGNKVDFLLMSATPIPRTLANTLYGDMDISTIETMPANRKKAITKIVDNNSITTIADNLFAELRNGRQIYVICSAIEKGVLNVRNVNEIFAYLEEFFKGYRVGLVHGKLDSAKKMSVMKQFTANKIQILVSTTVVEVGVNVPNATTIVIYDAYRFGLSQLHQLRGRVLRGSHQAYCYLLANKHEDSFARLRVLAESSDGFEIANQDLRLRGPGDILGQRQSGLPSLILGNLFSDTKIIEVSKMDAFEIISNQDIQENSDLVNKMIKLNQEHLLYVD